MKRINWMGVLLSVAAFQVQAKDLEARVYNASSGEQVIVADRSDGGVLIQVKNAKSILNDLVLSYKTQHYDAEIDFLTTVYGRNYVLLMATYDYDAPFNASELQMNLPESERTVKLVYSESDSADVKLADLAKLEKAQSNKIRELSEYDYDRAKWLENKKLPQFGFVQSKLKKLKDKCGKEVSLRYDWEQSNPNMLKEIDWSPAKFVGGGIDGLRRSCEEKAELKEKVVKVDELVVQPASKSNLRFADDTLYFSVQYDNADSLEEFFIFDNISSVIN